MGRGGLCLLGTGENCASQAKYAAEPAAGSKQKVSVGLVRKKVCIRAKGFRIYPCIRGSGKREAL